MEQAQTLGLGLVAALSVLVGLLLGWAAVSRAASAGARCFLNAAAAGVLMFLLWDVLSHAFEPVNYALAQLYGKLGGLGPVIGLAAVFFGGLVVGLGALISVETRLGRGRAGLDGAELDRAELDRAGLDRAGPGHASRSEAGYRLPPGPGAMTATEVTRTPVGTRLAWLIAVAIGVYNLGEGLAIGARAVEGVITLTALLVTGLVLHNIAQGFAIIAPLATVGEHPRWRSLLGMGVISGGPALLGAVIGQYFTSSALGPFTSTAVPTGLFTGLFALAAGAILYLLIALFTRADIHQRQRGLFYGGVLTGLIAGFLANIPMLMKFWPS